MKFWLNLFAFAAVGHLTLALGPNMICYYDASSEDRVGQAKFTIQDIESVIQFCTHLVYGYVGIDPETFEIISLNVQRDVKKRHFAAVTELKDRYPSTKFLLSVGGDKDLNKPEKYINLLESGKANQTKFIESARDVLRAYNFDGLDLAFQLPRNKPLKVHSEIGQVWKSFKKFFSGDQIVDEKSDEHKEQFTELVKDIRMAFRTYDLMLTLTVLPNVNSSWYFNAPAIINNLDYVNLAAFDFTTPERNPHEADYTAPLFHLPQEGNRMTHYSVDYQVDHWISQRVPHSKINVGITTYGRAWKMTTESKADGLPIVQHTDGPAPAGEETKTEGLLKYSEICQLTSPWKVDRKGDESPIKRIVDRTHKYGVYAYRSADSKGENGMWVSFEDTDTVATKATYVRNRGLGGVALFDLSMDDFRGNCANEKFPLLKAIKYKFCERCI
ncbi:chitinase-like protein Idgf3 isoform X1 [Stomoxys calcitrans]|uniref:chitinase-like protein Idgf3 isoform X1 n=1 Tax=Stomoxys calcitrans TaxID=35570 RepID=UPI0027E29DF6|nr:chitinase-like protein Idgf3 isoform X1 [Stomoxys calcitrans]